MLTVNVWASMSATPTTEAPAWKFDFAPPALTMIDECADQNPCGFHCTTRSLSHVKLPLGVADDVMVMVFSAARRSGMGPANVTVTGYATPTVMPEAGAIPATAGSVGTPAEPVATEPVTAAAARPTTTSRYRGALTMASVLFRGGFSTLSS